MSGQRNFLTSLLTNGASEIIQKVSRIAVVVVVARVMEAEAIGLAAAAIAAGDILKSLTETGVVQRIIAARDTALPGVVATARRLFWLWCAGLFAVQCLLATAIWLWTGETLISMMIALLALEYLVMPAGIVHCALAMRAGKLTGTAGVAGGQVVLANILTALLAIVFPSPLALILPRVLTAPVWLIGMRRLHPSTPAPISEAAPVSHFLGFGACLLSSEVIKPFYKEKSLRAVELLQDAIDDPRFRIHKPEGAIFLWLWFDELPITTMELYDRLKARGVLIVPGEYFFIGQEDEWDHAHQCLRMNYVQDDEAMQKGIAIIAEEVKKAYSEQ